jgi:hypothetical protein
MNPFQKGEQAKSGLYRPVIASSNAEMMAYENNPKIKGSTFLFAMPRSGSTLCMRLITCACLTKVTGDREKEFYEGLVTVHKYSTGGIYGKPEELEKQGVFYDRYCGPSEEVDQRMTAYHIHNLLFKGAGYGFAKTTILGFNNYLVEPVCNMIREMNEVSYYPIKIAWLMRDHEEIEKSFQTTDGPGMSWSNTMPGIVRELLAQQQQQFRSNYELGDAVINYKDLITNPKETILKLKPCHYPNDNIISQVMSRKLRS